MLLCCRGRSSAGPGPSQRAKAGPVAQPLPIATSLKTNHTSMNPPQRSFALTCAFMMVTCSFVENVPPTNALTFKAKEHASATRKTTKKNFTISSVSLKATLANASCLRYK